MEKMFFFCSVWHIYHTQDDDDWDCMSCVDWIVWEKGTRIYRVIHSITLIRTHTHTHTSIYIYIYIHTNEYRFDQFFGSPIDFNRGNQTTFSQITYRKNKVFINMSISVPFNVDYFYYTILFPIYFICCLTSFMRYISWWCNHRW